MTSSFSRLIIAVAMIISFGASNVYAASEDLQLLYPDNNAASGYDIIEFRARKSGMTHAFVALGRTLDNGATYFYAVGGFYPADGTGLVFVKNTLYSPGQVTYKIGDMTDDVVYRARMTDEQARGVRHILKNWNTKNYNIPVSYCIDLVTDIAKFLGLKYGAASSVLPITLTESLKSQNTFETPASNMEPAKDAAQVNALRQNETVALHQRLAARKDLPSALDYRIQDAQRNGAGAPPPPFSGPAWTMTPYVAPK